MARLIHCEEGRFGVGFCRGGRPRTMCSGWRGGEGRRGMVTILSVFVAERHEVTIDQRRCGDPHFPAVR